VATPGRALPTTEARAILPAEVPRADAIFNLQRVALLVHAIGAADGEALAEALRDRLHQPQRAPLVPGLADVLRDGVDGALGVFLSGAGPSLAAIARAGDAERVERAFQAFFAARGEEAVVRTLTVPNG
jgi:homoserine kinase